MRLVSNYYNLNALINFSSKLLCISSVLLAFYYIIAGGIITLIMLKCIKLNMLAETSVCTAEFPIVYRSSIN